MRPIQVLPCLLLGAAVPAAAQEPTIVVTGRDLDAGLGERAYDVTEIGRDAARP